MSEKARKRYSAEFKKEAVELVTVQGYSIAETARNLGVSANMLSIWKRSISQQNNAGQLSRDKEAELTRLREENRRLKMEREILKKAAAFFASETQ